MLVAGLAALLGFLLGVFVGFGAATPSAEEEPAPEVTVTVEESPSGQPQVSDPAQEAPPGNGQPSASLPADQPPASQPANQPPASQPAGQPASPPAGQPTTGQTPPGQNQPGQGQPSSGTGTDPAINPVSLRTMIVGKDIQPGTYRTTGPTAGFTMCYWARLRSATGDVIATGMPTGAASVTIQATDKAFLTGGCAEWTKA
ncbi:hypothetical protein FH608_036660 [Nonomuraea phyllanthi]|uniref:Uncharacterized protein n=1 Tax=Nonomuraea phyllanthi TaxID=2219224 RepID=A0A5C4VT59_9ACTN|nr:hypothetical protein [Nonomuraea phyllanthi]KAB8189998.1 hypothetical protein FH608_036660 [Nonomuraea phyllanthi]QFY08492.1 hypothetical protein GBF35_19045 [Nonomuraea phyllanthi]